MGWSLILALCVPLALFLPAWIFYLKRNSLTHWEFSLSAMKGIHFSADFVPQAMQAVEKNTAANRPMIADSLLQSQKAEKSVRSRRGKGNSGNPAARNYSTAGKQSAGKNLQ